MNCSEQDGATFQRLLDAVAAGGDDISEEELKPLIGNPDTMKPEVVSQRIEAMRTIVGQLICAEADAILASLRCTCGSALSNEGNTAAGWTETMVCKDATCGKIFHIDYVGDDFRLDRSTFREYHKSEK